MRPPEREQIACAWSSGTGVRGGTRFPHQRWPRTPNARRPTSCSVTPSTTASFPSPIAAAEHGTPSMRCCRNVPGGNAPPRHSRTRIPPPPRSGLRSQRPDDGGVKVVRGYGRSPSAAPSCRGSRTARQRLRRAAQQHVPLAQPLDERGVVLEARAVDDSARRLRHGGVDERGQAAACHDAIGAQVEVAEQIERDHIVAPRQVREHARAQGNQEEWLTGCDGARAYPRPARRRASP